MDEKIDLHDNIKSQFVSKYLFFPFLQFTKGIFIKWKYFFHKY